MKRKSRDNPRGEMPFLDHLEELRWRVFKALGALGVASMVGFLLVHYFHVTDLLIAPIREFMPDGRLAYFNPVTPFFIVLKLALLVGIVLAFPVIVYQVWAFLAPALEDRERRVIVPSLYLGLVLFTLGVVLAYAVALPVSLEFLMGFQVENLVATVGIDEYISFVVRLLLAFGIIFELPVVVMILTALGLATPRFLRSKRRHAIVAITITASFLSPGDVVMVTVLMMVPLILLYEFSILLSAMIHRRKGGAEGPEGEERIHRTSEPPEGAVEMGD